MNQIKMSKGEILKAEMIRDYLEDHQPNKVIKFYFKYFSKSSLPQDKSKSMWLTAWFLVLFAVGFTGTVINNRSLTAVATILFVATLFIFVTGYIYVAIANNLRLRKLCKELNLTKKEYEGLIDKMRFINFK